MLNVVVVTTAKGIEYLETYKQMHTKLNMDAVVLEDTWTGSEVQGLLEAEAKVKGHPFVIVNANHAHDPALIAGIAKTPQVLAGDGAACLIEHDVQGMVGLPQTTIFGAWPALDDERVTAVGTNLKAYNGVFAGLAAFPRSAFDKARALVETKPDADLSALLNAYAQSGALHLVKNEDNLVWLSGLWARTHAQPEKICRRSLTHSLSLTLTHSLSLPLTCAGLTEESRRFSVQQLERMGSPLTLRSGLEVVVLGDHSHSTDERGGDWSLFSVEKWRNAVFTTKVCVCVLWVQWPTAGFFFFFFSFLRHSPTLRFVCLLLSITRVCVCLCVCLCVFVCSPFSSSCMRTRTRLSRSKLRSLVGRTTCV